MIKALVRLSLLSFLGCVVIATIGCPGSGSGGGGGDDPICGDGTLDDGEQCDDGNTISGDGCDANCATEDGGGGGTNGGGAGDGGAGTTLRYDPLPEKRPDDQLAGFTLKTRWQKQTLKYFITSTTSDIPGSEQRGAFADAFAVWSAVVPLDFEETQSINDADMVIGFGTGSHCDLYSAAGSACPSGNEFDGPGGVLAHCYFPPGSGGENAGDCHFDDGETWGPASATTTIRLLEVATHEIGHGLGLGHSEEQDAIMFPSYSSGTVKLTLGQDDIAGIHELYGSRDRGIRPAMPTRPETPTVIPEDPTDVDGDSDGDGLEDGVELFLVGTDPFNPDTDGDGLLDIEVLFGLNPLVRDTDGDGVDDGQEILDGTDPLTPDRGFDGSAFAGFYTGQDSEGADLQFEVRPDGSAVGTLFVLQYGFQVDVGLFGGVDARGNIQLCSFDYIFTFTGNIAEGLAQGRTETVFGFVGTWSAVFRGAGVGPVDCDDSCSFAFDGECDDGRPGSVSDLCFPGTDCFDCDFIIPTAGDCFDSCAFAFDRECDDGREGAATALCAPGTDCTDCEGGGGCEDTCDFALDGECDDGRSGSITGLCAPGTDCTDCEAIGGGGGGCEDTCVFAFDGECDDGGPNSLTDLCASGTDCSDCTGGGILCIDTCEFAFDGECDELTGLCDVGTDCFDCGFIIEIGVVVGKTRIRPASVGRAKTDVYQPVISRRQPLTHPAHQRVDWRNAKK